MSAQKVVVIPDGKIYDYVNGKIRNDTPEEYVRQTIEKRLVNEHKYTPSQIEVEFMLQIGTRKPRADLVIWGSDATEHTQNTAKMIIECKKETVEARNAKDGIAQLQSYMSVCPNCEWGMWTNSIQKYVFRKCVENGQIKFVEYNDIPSANGNLEDVNRPSRASLRDAFDDNLLFVFKTCHNHIYTNDGLQKQPAFFELLKVIFCKIEDERNIPNRLEFYTTSEERSNPDGQLTVQKRIGNALLPPHEWSDEFKTRLSEALHMDKAEIRNQNTIAFFDVIVTNPPFGSKLPILDEYILEQFELAHIWMCDKVTGTWIMTPRLQSSVPPEILFIERCTQLLVPGGRMGIVLPDSILGSPGLGYIRQWLIQNHRIVASIDLHVDTFQPRNGTQTSVLVLQKKTDSQKRQEEQSGQIETPILPFQLQKMLREALFEPLF